MTGLWQAQLPLGAGGTSQAGQERKTEWFRQGHTAASEQARQETDEREVDRQDQHADSA